MRRNIFGAILILLLVAIVGEACMPSPTPTAIPIATLSATATFTPSPTSTPTRGLAVPAASEVLGQQRVDLNADGIEERVVAFRSTAGDGLAIDDWQVMLPASQRIEELRVRVMHVGSPPDVLCFAADKDGITRYLYIYAWDGASYTAQKPRDGPLDGEEAFRSLYFVPLVEDGDFNGTEEILVTLETENPDYVRVVFYEWDGSIFRHSLRFMAIPKHVPTR